jgi:predicted nucleotidyltransferase component of viral defense system
MIDKQEILIAARELNLSPHIVEKDYVLSWILGGIATHTLLRQALVFKGGTCLKKCFFQSYRFSEDLDFTVNKYSYVDEHFLLDNFVEISEWIYDTVGIEIPTKNLSFKSSGSKAVNPMITGKLSYRGPLQRQRGGMSEIKIDINLNEQLVCSPEKRSIYHPYADNFDEKIAINTYCIEEIFAEKLRALADRLRPRDLYDVTSLYAEKKLWQPEAKKILEILQVKCKHRNIPLPTLELLDAKSEKPELITEWHNMLAHQIGFLQPFENYWQSLPEVLNWLYAQTY